MKVLLGMSGGIDSSMAAVLLQNRGYEVVGISFRFIDDNTSFADAEKIAQRLNIPYYQVDVREVFNNKIISYFTEEYLKGRIPFPCAKCNKELKWTLMFDYAEKFGCEKISMGHYVKIVEKNGALFVAEGKDKNKDQSFFLWGLTQEQLKRIIFPLGNYLKSEIKQRAEKMGFNFLREKKESTGVCFCAGDYRPFLHSQIENPEEYFKQGKFIDEACNVLGMHNGYPLFTVGQRRGFGLQLNRAMFVKEIKPETNEVVLAPLKNMYRIEFYVSDYQLVDVSLFTDEFDVNTRIRYRKQDTLSRVQLLENNLIKVELKEPLESIAPGQTAVFYRAGKVLGGGFIR